VFFGLQSSGSGKILHNTRLDLALCDFEVPFVGDLSCFSFFAVVACASVDAHAGSTSLFIASSDQGSQASERRYAGNGA